MTESQRLGDFYPVWASTYVPNMQYHADVDESGTYRASLGALPAADVDALVAVGLQSAAAATYTASGGTITNAISSAKYGQIVIVDADGTSTRKVYVHGKDYLGQPMYEVIAANGATAVNGDKAFKEITKITTEATAGTETLTIGWGAQYGLPFKSLRLDTELHNAAVPTNAGAIQAGIATDPQTATTDDPRGLYAPHASELPDGSKVIDLLLIADRDNLYGVQHYYP